MSSRIGTSFAFLCYAFSALSHADSLTEIAAFAEKICDQSIVGSESSNSIEGRLNGDVNGLATALGITVSGGALVKQDGSGYEGISKDNLPTSIPTREAKQFCHRSGNRDL